AMAVKRRCSVRTARGMQCRRTAREGTEPPVCSRHLTLRLGPPRDEERCVAITVPGHRCRLRAVRDGLCKRHLRPRKHGPGGKVRCVARRRDGQQCESWAMKKLQDSERPLCCYHAEHFVFCATPPDERRCVAITASGERCTLWTVADGVGGGRLCSLH